MRKDIKKSSYYVWFLGAEEAKGLRGPEYIAPVLRNLVEREKDVEPHKVTLQVSHKGLKIVQNVPVSVPGASGPKAGGGGVDVVKHFIPHHAVTCVHQQDDLVAYILLLYNPVSKCPVHVHAFRCDSMETAAVLHGQLRVITERPDNQKKLAEIESRLSAKGLLAHGPPRKRVAAQGSDGRSTKESESSGGSSLERLSSGGHQERIASLYDSLAAELREKLGTRGPILLPPRDYDTVHRQKGDLSAVTSRRCLNTSIVGASVNEVSAAVASTAAIPLARPTSSGGSSGIGSDHAPSPDHESDARFLDNHSTSDEEWNAEPLKDSLFLGQARSGGGGGGNGGGGSGELSLPRPRRLHSTGFDSPSSPEPPRPSPYRGRSQPREDEPTIRPEVVRINKQYASEGPGPGQRRRKNAEERQRSPSLTNARSSVGSLTPRDRFNDAKEKFLLLEREKNEEQERQERALMNERRRPRLPVEPPISPAVHPVVRSRWSRSKDSEDDVEDLPQHVYSSTDDFKYETEYPSGRRRDPSYSKGQMHDSIPDSDDYQARHHTKPNLPYPQREDRFRKINSSPSRRNLDGHSYSGVSEDKSNPAPNPRREWSPDIKPRKDRCNSPSYDSRPVARIYPNGCSFDEVNSRFVGKIPRSHLNMNPVPFAENNSAIPLERYRSPSRVNSVPKPTPRLHRYPSKNSEEEEDNHDYRPKMYSENLNYPPRVPYDNNDKKRMSMYESIEDERRRNSNELAKEFKRRSYQDHRHNTDMMCANGVGYQELDDRERYPGLDRESARIHKEEEEAGATTTPRYRHSYAEPFHHYQQPVQQHHEMLHRTNSSLSSGRVGIAAIHPY